VRAALILMALTSLVVGCFCSTPASSAAVRAGSARTAAADTIGQLKSAIEANGRPMLCQISNISPVEFGGTLNIEIFSYSVTNRCDNRSTAHQGVLFFVEGASVYNADYLVRLASVTPAFNAGWRSGSVSVLLGEGASLLRQYQVTKALQGHALFGFSRH
jgi:hypothetical protein